MAHGRPWYKRNGGTFLMSTLGMPDEATKWAYSALLDMLNDRDRPLSDDAGFICGFTGLTRKKWSIARRWLLENESNDGEPFLILTERGDLTNPGFERERAERRGEYERSVEAGREGGRKSAAMRAAGQGDLDLAPAEKSGKVGGKYPRKSPDSTPDSPIDPPEKVAPRHRKTSDLAEAPPQPSRARQSQELREERINRTTESESSDPRAAFLATFDLVCTAAGFNPRKPEHIETAHAQLQGWIDQGLDIERTVLPAIRKTVAASDDPTSSLARFNRLIGYSAARAAAAPHRPANGTPIASAGPDDSDERLPPIRTGLRRRLGARAYDGWIAPIRLSIEGSTLIASASSPFAADWLHTNFATPLAEEAKAQHLTGVKITTVSAGQHSGP